VGYVSWRQEAALTTPAPPKSRHSDDDLADEVEDLGFGLMAAAPVPVTSATSREPTRRAWLCAAPIWAGERKDDGAS
jgi:hypothetical protein